MSLTQGDVEQAPVGGAATRARSDRRGVLRNRALAVVVALGVVAVLLVGWLADSVISAPQAATQGALTQQVGLTTVALTFDPEPLRAGSLTALSLRMTDVSGQAVVGARARCALSMPAMGMALPAGATTPTAQPGMYTCPAQVFSPGAWALDLTLTLPSGETDHATFQFTVA